MDTYSDGEQALIGLRRRAAELAILDIKMPRLDGMELLQKIRVSSAMPVIFLTSKDDELDEALGLRMGADDYITKPFSQRLLLERVRPCSGVLISTTIPDRKGSSLSATCRWIRIVIPAHGKAWM